MTDPETQTIMSMKYSGGKRALLLIDRWGETQRTWLGDRWPRGDKTANDVPVIVDTGWGVAATEPTGKIGLDEPAAIVDETTIKVSPHDLPAPLMP